MVESPVINLRHIARGIALPVPQVQAVVELLDEGNTVPFITRYRKDQTGGLDEEQIRQIQDRLVKMRLLAERKQTILRSIEAQGKLTEELSKQIQSAGTTKRLEDLYLPYRPKKQTLATLARSRGLEQLAQEILDADQMAADLDARAADFVSTDRGVATPAEALLGAGHILAERFSEAAELRQKLREIMQRTGKLTSQEIASETKPAEQKTPAAEKAPAEQQTPSEPETTVEPDAVAPETEEVATQAVEQEDADAANASEADESDAAVASEAETEEPSDAGDAGGETTSSDAGEIESDSGSKTPSGDAGEKKNVGEKKSKAKPPAAPQPKAKKLTKAQQKKKQLQEKKIKAFRDYFNYSEELRKAPPHRVLAINRGERAKILRVKIECDMEAVCKAADEMLVPPGHPHEDFLRGCVRDSLSRLIVPSLEREMRRELTDRAELHAVGVFAKNLRNLLLQSPIRDRRVLAVDPGFKSGCKLVALDQFGNILEQAVIYIIGREQRLQQAKETVIDLVDRFNLSVVAIGNGTACRQSEDFLAKLIGEELASRGAAYVIVNEAGASVYSTSQLGREEFPNYDATVRGAISIGRRLQDPLSELVKIDPASIGVGMYQHDVKAKHLRVSLDEVVESCVNFVGVDVNTASPALLKYVSGLNQLTARRVYEHRMQNGPFRNRRQLMDVPGFGEATFVQAAGFLKIAGGDQPLDSTWIHPESYTVADRILARIDCRPEDIGGGGQAKSLAERIAALDVGAATEQLGVGELLLKDILAQLARPGRDPREDLPKPVFKKGVIKLEDLAEGMELTGTILNVVDFGAFVDIGMHDSGLVHVSQLADKFIRDPHEVVAVGDVVKVWVVGVDKDRRRVSLTMIKPGSKPDESTRGEKKEGEVRRERPEGGRAAKGKDEGQGGRRRYDRKDAEKPEGERKRTEGRRYEGRQQRGKGRQRGDERQGERREREQFQPKSKPKPFVPITDAMKTGKEAMRTFGDLAQYFNIGVPDEKQEDHRRDDHKKKNRKSPRQTGDSPKAAADSPGSVENNQEPPQQTPPPADAAAERQEAAPSLVSERVVEEQETPSAVIENVARVAEEQETPPSGESPQ